MLTLIRWGSTKTKKAEERCLIFFFVPKVNTAHQAKLEELKKEISEVDRKSSENCVVSSSIPFHLYEKVQLAKSCKRLLCLELICLEASTNLQSNSSIATKKYLINRIRFKEGALFLPSNKECQVRSRGEKSAEESLHCLPEDERSEVGHHFHHHQQHHKHQHHHHQHCHQKVGADLECPVCYELSRPPIYQCPEGHIICSGLSPSIICSGSF